jgi:diaminohydroxyphosphoribosylaminopyrimidine deaminase/5-amino-6-(5-phosphoribosylamino)uracil reductase
VKTSFSEHDAAFMRRALALARRGQGRVEPNPMVGAVVVREGRIVGEGFHRRYGGPHAEVEALAAAGRRAKGATLYVTLEPCCHWGKTPPCTDAVLAAGIRRVVAAMIDPFPEVRGKGAALLRRQGVRVETGLLEPEARILLAPFLTRLLHRRPFVIVKWAQSLDGALATAGGESKWISSEHSRAFVQQLRGRVDGILVGAGTAQADDPLLTARLTRPPRTPRRIATRIVIDSQCGLSLQSRLVQTIPDAPVLVAHHEELSSAAGRRRKALAARGVMTVAVPGDVHGGLRLEPLLAHLASMEYTNILVEGGAETLSSFFRAGLVDEAELFIAPLLIGGKNAPRAAQSLSGRGRDLKRLADAARMEITRVARSGPDIHLTLRKMSENS